jgi:hypothetical protein
VPISDARRQFLLAHADRSLGDQSTPGLAFNTSMLRGRAWLKPTWSVPASPGSPVFTFPRSSTGRGHQPQLLQFENLVLGLGEFLQMRHLQVLVPLQAVGPVFVEGELGWIVIVWCSQYSTQPSSARVGSIRPDRIFSSTWPLTARRCATTVNCSVIPASPPYSSGPPLEPRCHSASFHAPPRPRAAE